LLRRRSVVTEEEELAEEEECSVLSSFAIEGMEYSVLGSSLLAC
jgi:hypothetical protein